MTMLSALPLPAPGEPATAEEYLVSHGKNGGLGRFLPVVPLTLERGSKVVVVSNRGLELGTVLCPAGPRHLQVLSHVTPGQLLRRATPEDEELNEQFRRLAQEVFEESRRLGAELHLPLEILDAEVLLDGRHVILQHLSAGEWQAASLVEALNRKYHLEVLLENLSIPAGEKDDPGCGKPDCGRNAGGSCASCGSEGGCSSCGAGKVDMRAYFAHLRTQMEDRQRTPLL